MKARLMIHAAAIGLCATAAQGWAQEPLETKDAQASADGHLIEDIIVTARRRDESIQKVPVAISVFSPDRLASAGIRTVQDLVLVTPGLNVASGQTGGRTRPSYELRGIFGGEVLGTQDQAVGIYVDDIYVARPNGTNQTMFDLENVQVLYGPQGTLFGRNTTAGALVFTSKRPTDAWEGEASAGVGNYGAVELGGVANVPLADSAKLRIAGQYATRGGFRTNVRNGADIDDDTNYAVRASLLLTPLDRLENLTIGSFYRAHNHGWSVRLTGAVPVGSTFTLPDGTIATLSSTTAGLYGQRLFDAITESNARDDKDVWSDRDDYVRTRTWAVTNTTKFELSDALTLKNIFGYRNVTDGLGRDNDGTPLNISGGSPTDQQAGLSSMGHQVSEELQLQGNSFGGALDWIGGLYYFKERFHEVTISQTLIDTPFGATSPTSTIYTAHNTSKSAYAQATWHIMDALSLTAGGRYTWDQRRVLFDRPQRLLGKPGQTCNLAPAFDTADGVADCMASRSIKFDEPTYNVSLDYTPVRDLLLYVAHRRGYRAGGFSGRALNEVQATPFAPERVKDVELGAKALILLGADTSLRANLALYKTWYDNIQRQGSIPTATGPQSLVLNAAKATIKGFELDTTLTLSHLVTATANWGHVEAVHNRFFYAPAAGSYTFDIPFGNAKNTFNASLSLTPVDRPEVGKVTATSTFSYKGAWYNTADLPVLSPLERIASRKLVGFSVDWENILGTQSSAQLWVRNAFNEKYSVGSLALATSLGIVAQFPGDPRTIGVTIRRKFGRN